MSYMFQIETNSCKSETNWRHFSETNSCKSDTICFIAFQAGRDTTSYLVDPPGFIPKVSVDFSPRGTQEAGSLGDAHGSMQQH